MKRNTKVDYLEEEGKPEIINLNAVELSDMIEAKLENKSKGRPSAALKKEINEMIDEFNRKFTKVYSRIS